MDLNAEDAEVRTEGRRERRSLCVLCQIRRDLGVKEKGRTNLL